MKEDEPVGTSSLPGPQTGLEERLESALLASRSAKAYNREAEDYQPAIAQLAQAVEALVVIIRELASGVHPVSKEGE